MIVEIWRQIESFAGYSFCKGHSAAFAVLSYQTAWLKSHFPAEFMAGVLANGGGFYGLGAYVSEARRMGLRVLHPDVNYSEAHFTGRTLREPDVRRYGQSFGEAGQREALGWIRTGLLAVKDVSLKSIQRIIEQRRWKEFSSLQDFLSRSETGREETDRLIRVGAFDQLPTEIKNDWDEDKKPPPPATRPKHLLYLDTWLNRAADAMGSLF